jgi:hypothetical protein
MATRNHLTEVKKYADRPRDIEGYRKILVYGRNKKGKTTLALSGGVEKTLVLDPEKGTDAMLEKNPYRIHITKWETINDVWNVLRTGSCSPAMLGLGKSDEPFKWVAIDGLTRINNLALRYVMKVEEERNLDRRPGMVDRRDYNKSGELMKEMLQNFHNLKLHCCYTAQERMITMDEDDELGESSHFFVPDLPQAVRGAANGIVEVIGRIYTTRVTLKSGKEATQRRLYVGVHPTYDTGYRSDFVLPDYIKNPTLPKLVSLMTSGAEG